MTLANFIKENREELDRYIRRVNPDGPRLDNEERRQWILNDEDLYNWARREGVDV